MRAAAALALLVSLTLGCGHATTTEPAPSSAASKPAPRPEPRQKTARARSEHELVSPRPDNLLAPGAEEEIRNKLKTAGFLGAGDAKVSLTDGLRRFQAARDLPATGVADHETVRKLGLDPEEVFRKAEAAPKAGDDHR
jgi:hypothetical protein